MSQRLSTDLVRIWKAPGKLQPLASSGFQGFGFGPRAGRCPWNPSNFGLESWLSMTFCYPPCFYQHGALSSCHRDPEANSLRCLRYCTPWGITGSSVAFYGSLALVYVLPWACYIWCFFNNIQLPHIQVVVQPSAVKDWAQTCMIVRTYVGKSWNIQFTVSLPGSAGIYVTAWGHSLKDSRT